MSHSDPCHLTPVPYSLYYTPSIRSRAPGEVELGYRLLREFYAPYKRLVLPEQED